MDRVKELVMSVEDKVIEYRRSFHKYPEPGWTEFRTASVVVDTLQNLGYEVKYGKDAVTKEDMMGVPSDEELAIFMERAVSQGANPEIVKNMEGGLTGVIAELKCGEGPTFAFRFDMDSNDIDEAKDDKHRPYREGFSSVNEKAMHACGHDGHTAMGLGLAEVLSNMKDDIKGTIRLIFQPGEEGVRGARAMVSAGAVDGVDYIIGAHIGFQSKKVGDIICGTEGFLATTKLDIKFKGIPAHAAAAPEEGRNALLAAATTAINLHAITRHGKGTSRINVGILNAGQGRNVIPPNAILKIETRGLTSEIDDFMHESARRVVEGAAKMYDVDYDIKIVGGTKSGYSSPEMIQIIKEVAQEMDYFKNITENSDFGAAEDYSHFMSIVQQNGGIGTYLQIGANMTAGHHDFYFDFDESVLASGVEIMTRAALKVLG